MPNRRDTRQSGAFTDATNKLNTDTLDFNNQGSNSLKLSASKRAKTENYNTAQSAVNKDGILTKLFESPLGMIRRMWSGFGSQHNQTSSPTAS